MQKQVKPLSEDILMNSSQNHQNHKIPNKGLIVTSINYCIKLTRFSLMYHTVLTSLQDMMTSIKGDEIIVEGDYDLEGLVEDDANRINKILLVHRWKHSKQMKILYKDVKGKAIRKSANFGNLKKLTLNFPKWESRIGYHGLKVLKNLIEANSNNLKSLSLSFVGCDEITKRQGKFFRDDFAECLKNLKQFSLHISNCDHTSDRNIDMLASRFLKHLTSLQKLNLEFTECPEIHGQDLSILGATIKHRLVKLRDLRIIFARYRCHSKKKIILDGFEAKSLGIASPMQTMILKIAFIQPKYDKGVGNLGSELTEYLRNFQHLSLNFASDPKNTEIAAQILISKITHHLVHLRHLELNFVYCFETDLPLKILLQISSQLNNLERLSVNFKAFELTEKALEIFGYQLEAHLAHLERLDLDFTNCVLMSNKAVKNLLKKISGQMKQLQEINIIFHNSLASLIELFRKILMPIPTVNVGIIDCCV